MPVGHYAFRLLELSEQLATVWQEGQFLATRFEDGHAVNLYRMDGDFFAEIYYQQEQDVLSRVRTFNSGKCLEPYAAYIRLEDLEN